MHIVMRQAALLLALIVLGACLGSSGEAPTEEPSAMSSLETGSSPTVGAPAATPTPLPTAIVVSTLPIIDMHFHPDAAWNLTALVALMDDLGVKKAVGGTGGDGRVALDFAAQYPDRFVPYAGQDAIRALYLAEGTAVTTLQSDRALRYLATLEESLEAGCWAGIGELFVNTVGSHRSNAMRMPADSPLMRRLWDYAATFDTPLSVHMDADPISVAELQRLVATNRNATWIWAHSGWYAQPAQLRELLQAHPNLMLELSFRDELRSFFAVSTNGRLTESWRQLLEAMPERFLLGTDLLPPPTAAKYRDLILFWRSVLEQLTPSTAAKLAFENAERLLAESRRVDISGCR